MQNARQQLLSRHLTDVTGGVREQIVALRDTFDLPPGASVAVGCGSRGISNYAAIVKGVVDGLCDLGVAPFCFPAMGSHRSATGPGQARVLATAGISPKTMGCPGCRSRTSMSW
ncbi:MAG: hypothetical protein QM650_06475 [Microlunatus sp.]